MKKLIVILITAVVLLTFMSNCRTKAEVSPSFYEVTGHPVEDTAHVISINSVKFD